MITAGMTAFYVFRSIFLAFFGKYRGNQHPHESPLIMTAPLMVLAVLSLFGGFLPIPHFLEPMFPHHEEGEARHAGHHRDGSGLERYSARLSLLRCEARALGFDGYALSAARTAGSTTSTSSMKRYDAMVVDPVVQGSRSVLWRGMDAGVIDGIVNGIGRRAEERRRRA